MKSQRIENNNYKYQNDIKWLKTIRKAMHDLGEEFNKKKN